MPRCQGAKVQGASVPKCQGAFGTRDRSSASGPGAQAGGTQVAVSTTIVGAQNPPKGRSAHAARQRSRDPCSGLHHHRRGAAAADHPHRVPARTRRGWRRVLISLLGSGECAYTMDYGDGNTERRTATLPDEMRHAYEADNEYSVVATPEAPCEGTARARLDIRAISARDLESDGRPRTLDRGAGNRRDGRGPRRLRGDARLRRRPPGSTRRRAAARRRPTPTKKRAPTSCVPQPRRPAVEMCVCRLTSGGEPPTPRRHWNSCGTNSSR